jgi:two-component system sensor histidine kinase CpxA
VVQVTDFGPGVPPDALDKLFRPFYRIDDARGRQTGGVGLGLAITERAVRLHGGTVRAANRAEGGLIIEIRLPMVEREVAAPVLEPAGTAGD